MGLTSRVGYSQVRLTRTTTIGPYKSKGNKLSDADMNSNRASFFDIVTRQVVVVVFLVIAVRLCPVPGIEGIVSVGP